ncbi:hypothetical protein LX36DRAFT_656277 [Colletotrichum falcatum]|nr:hypothetical protein LX36DRAFT_656277 [Colletotrichum falcatum]
MRFWSTLQVRTRRSNDRRPQRILQQAIQLPFSHWERGGIQAPDGISQLCFAQDNDDEEEEEEDDMSSTAWRSAALRGMALLGILLLGTWQGLRFSIRMRLDSIAKRRPKTGGAPV